MGLVRFWAVGIDDLRDLFSASPHLTTRLRELAGAVWPTPELRPRGNKLDKLGPFSRRAAGAPIIRPGVPHGRDLDDLVHGRDIAPERLTAAWALVELWLDDAAVDGLGFEIGEPTMDDLDFALACGGVDARYSLRKLFNDALAIPLKPDAGRVTGYVRAGHAEVMGRAWAEALPHLSDEQRAIAQPVAGWLARFGRGPGSTTREGGAAASDHPAPDHPTPDYLRPERRVPDLVASYRSLSRAPAR